MANITEFINKIKNAVYGKEVRDSIIDAINAINVENLVTISSATINDGNLILSLTDGTTINCGNTKGTDGKSAYEIAVDGGYAGTEEAFIQALAGMGSRGTDIVATVDNLPVSPTEGDMLYLETTGRVTLSHALVPLKGLEAESEDVNITDKIYSKLYFNPTPDISGTDYINTEDSVNIVSKISKSAITLSDISDSSDTFFWRLSMGLIADIVEGGYTGTERIFLVTYGSDYEESTFAYVTSNVTFNVDTDAFITCVPGWNKINVSYTYENDEEVYTYTVKSCDEPTITNVCLYCDYADYFADFEATLALLANYLQPYPYYVDLPKGIIEYKGGQWNPQDYASKSELAKTIENLDESHMGIIKSITAEVSDLQNKAHKHSNLPTLDLLDSYIAPVWNTNFRNVYADTLKINGRWADNLLSSQSMYKVGLFKVSNDCYALYNITGSLPGEYRIDTFRNSVSTTLVLKFPDGTIYNCRLGAAVPEDYNSPTGQYLSFESTADLSNNYSCNVKLFAKNSDFYIINSVADSNVVATLMRTTDEYHNLFSAFDAYCTDSSIGELVSISGVEAFISIAQCLDARNAYSWGYNNIYLDDVLYTKVYTVVQRGSTIFNDVFPGQFMPSTGTYTIDTEKTDKFLFISESNFIINTYIKTIGI